MGRPWRVIRTLSPPHLVEDLRQTRFGVGRLEGNGAPVRERTAKDRVCRRRLGGQRWACAP